MAISATARFYCMTYPFRKGVLHSYFVLARFSQKTIIENYLIPWKYDSERTVAFEHFRRYNFSWVMNGGRKRFKGTNTFLKTLKNVIVCNVPKYGILQH